MSEIQYPPIRDMERHVLEKGGKLSAPLTIFLEITNACNQDCVFCIQAGKRQEKTYEIIYMSLEHIDKLFHEANILGVLEFYITGGEPTCHPQFLEIITLVKKYRFRVSILTNGINFSSAGIKKLSSILEPERDWLLLALDAADRTAYRSLRGQAHFNSLLGTFEMLRAAGLPFATQSVIVKSNIAFLEDIWKLSSEYKARAHTLILPYQKKEMDSNIYASKEEIQLSLDGLLNPITVPNEYRNPLILPGKPGQKKGEKTDKVGTKPHCRAGYTSCAISARGEVHSCAYALDIGLSFGNFLDISLAEAWKSINPGLRGKGCSF